jgi:hypothetical protein
LLNRLPSRRLGRKSPLEVKYTFDVATRDEEETFHPVNFGLLDSGGAYALAKGVTTTVTDSLAPRTYSATESPGSSTGVETLPTEEAEPDIEDEDLESHTPNVGRSNCCEMTKNTVNWSDTTCLIFYLMLCTTVLYPLP